MLRATNSLEKVVETLQHAPNSQSFEAAMANLQFYMRDLGMDSKYVSELERRAYYLPNEYSEKDTKERMEDAKKRVIQYVREIMDYEQADVELIRILDNYYLFLENLIERKPHKSGGIKEEYFTCLRIKNEYDVQHLLYAYIKPLYPMARSEVSEDTGYGTVRTDIFLDSDHVIEVKCTRASMKQKRLIEEIEADMVHYSASHIYFFIYDKAKIVENPLVFKKKYEEIVTEKKIHITIHQPKLL